MRRKEFRQAFVASLPVLAGYLGLGGGFGILLSTVGYGVLWALGMSITMYSGSMQYMAVELIPNGSSLLTIGITTLLVNARHLFYGLSLLDEYKGAGWRKFFMIFQLTDETYSITCAGAPGADKQSRQRYYFYVSVLNHLYWIAGCSIGCIVGSLLKFNSQGIDFVLTALFITVFTDQWLKSRNHLAAIAGVASSVLCRLTFGADFLIPAMVCIALSLTLLRRYTGADETKEAEQDE